MLAKLVIGLSGVEEMERKGKENTKAKIKQKVEEAKIQAQIEEEKKAAMPDKFEQKRQKLLQSDREPSKIVVEQVDKEALNAPYTEVEYMMNG